jgi:hypothetical protein
VLSYFHDACHENEQVYGPGRHASQNKCRMNLISLPVDL